MTPDLTGIMDFLLRFCHAQETDNGEDCELYSVNRNEALFASFDGCGGSGAKRYSRFHRKTGAFIAARAAAMAVRCWFEQTPRRDAASMQQMINRALEHCQDLVGEQSAFIGQMAKTFPTTMAAVILHRDPAGWAADLYWVGDSRVYLLNADGLAQLTEDDLDGVDAMDNLSQDAALTGVISLSASYRIHTGRVMLDKPAVILTATDGCFGYYSTPMEFEGLLLSTLMHAESASAWEGQLAASIDRVAGDDYTLCGCSFGFGSFAGLRRALQPRAAYLEQAYIARLARMQPEQKRQLWLSYRDHYYRLLRRG